MDRFSFHRQITPPLLVLTLVALVLGCAAVREETLLPAYPVASQELYSGGSLPENSETIFDQEAAGDTIFDQPEQAQSEPRVNGEAPYAPAAGWSYNSYYAYGRPFDPDYCDPFLGEPFCSSYKSFHDPYWYYYNAYFYPYQPYYPFYPYFPCYGYSYDNDEHHYKRGFWHSLKHRAHDRNDARDTVTGRVNEWREQRKDRWHEIEEAIRERRDARMEQWQGIRDRAQDRREERIEQWQNFRGSVRRTASGRGEKSEGIGGAIFLTMRGTRFQGLESSGRSGQNNGGTSLKSTACCAMIITSPCLTAAILIMAAAAGSLTEAYCAAGAAGGNSGDLSDNKAGP